MRAKDRSRQTTASAGIPSSLKIDFRSEVNRRSYSISVARSLAPVPETGCPILYVLDGDWYFGSATEAVRRCAPGVVVVGIGYPDDNAYIENVLHRHQPLPPWVKDDSPFMAAVGFERMYDLSLPVRDEILTSDFSASPNITASDVGGLDAFLKVLEVDVKPRVAAIIPTDFSNQAIFGHSLGGLAVVHALFTEPAAFRTFIAASPSLWWNEEAVLAGEAKFTEAVRAGVASPRLLITAGGEEEAADTKMAAKLEMDFADYAVRIRKARMIANARELTERLRAVRGSGSFEVEECAVFPTQDHAISAWPALGRGISFAFP